MDILGEACKWIIQGVAVIPIWPRSKKPALSTWKEFQTRLPTLEELAKWFRLPRNLAVVTGWNGLAVLDFDRFDRFVEWWEAYPIETYMVGTSRGVHAYFFMDEQPKNIKVPGIDFQTVGNYVLAPPSIHPNGTVYQILGDWPIVRIHQVEEIIPAAWIDAEVKPVKQVEIPEVKHEDNPWDVVNQPESYATLVENIKAKFKILDYFPDAQKSDKSGRWWIAKCPFHEDHSPSLWIDTVRGLAGCYVCRMPVMDVINLTGRLFQITNSEAIEKLRNQL